MARKFQRQVIATAPSMNGYTSAAAALLSAGVKVTTPARAPIACLFDLDVVAAAPQRMIAAGFGDLLSRAVSMADWRLSHRLLQTPYDQESADLMTAAADLVEEIEAGLRVRAHAAVARLCAALSVSGAAMALAGALDPSGAGGGARGSCSPPPARRSSRASRRCPARCGSRRDRR